MSWRSSSRCVANFNVHNSVLYPAADPTSPEEASGESEGVHPKGKEDSSNSVEMGDIGHSLSGARIASAHNGSERKRFSTVDRCGSVDRAAGSDIPSIRCQVFSKRLPSASTAVRDST